jgi:hypothetical protein
MVVGVQFTGTVGSGAARRWFTYNWPAGRQVVWTVVPTSAHSGSPQLEWDVAVERTSSDRITYWISVKNLSANDVNIEARYAILD